jgi:microcystin-dependent protein
MLGMPTFDLTSEIGKQDFQKWITYIIKNEINSYSRQVLNIDNTGVSGGGGAPTGPAGGGLTGTYPDPLIYPEMTGITSISTPQFISFNTINPGAVEVGRLVWSIEDGGLLFSAEGGLEVPLNQKNIIYVKNQTGSTITKGMSVMATGAAGDRITIAPAVSNGSVNAMFMLGVAAKNIVNDSFGFVVTNGYVRNINTNAYSVGTILYFDPTTPGGLTTTEPAAPNIDLPIAIVTKQNSSSGILYVRMKNGEYLREIHDVRITSAANGDVLKYNSALGVWENVASDDIPAHAGTHELGGSDEVEIAPSQVTGTAIVEGDARLTNSRTPTAHTSTHIPGGSDEIDLTKIVGIGTTLPTLPNSLYPAGSLFGVGSVAPYLLYRSTGSAWDQIGGAGGGGITISDTAPATPSAGDLWYDSTTGRTYVYYDSFWVEVGNTTPPVMAPTAEDFLPAGIIVPSATIVEPSGWLFCYGQTLNSISNATYARLFSAIGTTYGGSGASSFVVPDLRGRSAFGRDDMGGTAASRVTNAASSITGTALGANGGAQTHTLTTAQMPSHGHNAPSGFHFLTNQNNAPWSQNNFAGNINMNGGFTTTSTGGNGAHQNMPPTIILNYLIKT